MTLRVEQGKGRKDRYARLSPLLLPRLRAWWRSAHAEGRIRAEGWLFPGADPMLPLSARQLNRVVHAAAEAAGIEKRVAMHTLRHVAAEVLQTIAADPKHLGARIGATLVLHAWGSALTHHPHVHGIVPGGALTPGGSRWVACRRGFFRPVRVLSRLFRRRFIGALQAAHNRGELRLQGGLAGLADGAEFKRWLAPLRKVEWVVYPKGPFAGPAMRRLRAARGPSIPHSDSLKPHCDVHRGFLL